jgi:hypothetical protein
MSWLSWHEVSEQAASDAHAALRAGDQNHAVQSFRKAAEAEIKALDDLDHSKARTLGITVVSAVSLWYKAGEFLQAEQLAMKFLSSGLLPQFATSQVRQLIQSIWIAQAMNAGGTSFLPGQVIISVKGGQTVVGGAPLDLILSKVQAVEALFYRTIEYIKGAPHRKRGGPPPEIQQLCRPWLFQTQPGSYQFTVAIQQPAQRDFFHEGPKPEEVADQFLAILKASSEGPADLLPALVSSDEYRTTFLKLTRNLAPTGQNFGSVEVREAKEAAGVVLLPDTRKNINHVLRPFVPKKARSSEEQVEIHGTLRALHLDQDWLELWDGSRATRVDGLAEAVDDVIGPMVNRKVVVQAQRYRRKLNFIDIEEE